MPLASVDQRKANPAAPVIHRAPVPARREAALPPAAAPMLRKVLINPLHRAVQISPAAVLPAQAPRPAPAQTAIPANRAPLLAILLHRAATPLLKVSPKKLANREFASQVRAGDRKLRLPVAFLFKRGPDHAASSLLRCQRFYHARSAFPDPTRSRESQGRSP